MIITNYEENNCLSLVYLITILQYTVRRMINEQIMLTMVYTLPVTITELLFVHKYNNIIVLRYTNVSYLDVRTVIATVVL